MFNSPSNPSGAAYSGEELDALGEVIRRHQHVMVMTDDMFEHVWYADFEFTTFSQRCPDLADRILTVNGCSNDFAMTAWHIGSEEHTSELQSLMSRPSAVFRLKTNNSN